MNYELKIQELTERIEKLEKAEAKRVAKKKMEIAFAIVKLVVIVGLLVAGYIYVNNTLIKPYKEKVDFVEEKVNTVNDFIQEKWDVIKKFSIFN